MLPACLRGTASGRVSDGVPAWAIGGSALLVKEVWRNPQRDRANDCSTKFFFLVVQKP